MIQWMWSSANSASAKGYKVKPRDDEMEVEGKGMMKLEDAIVGTVVKRLTVEMLKEYFEGISQVTED